MSHYDERLPGVEQPPDTDILDSSMYMHKEKACVPYKPITHSIYPKQSRVPMGLCYVPRGRGPLKICLTVPHPEQFRDSVFRSHQFVDPTSDQSFRFASRCHRDPSLNSADRSAFKPKGGGKFILSQAMNITGLLNNLSYSSFRCRALSHRRVPSSTVFGI